MTTTIDKEQNYYFTNNTDIPNDHFDMDAIKEFLNSLGSPDYKDTHLTMVKGEAILNVNSSLTISYKATYKWDPELEPLSQDPFQDIIDLEVLQDEWDLTPLDYKATFKILDETTLEITIQV